MKYNNEYLEIPIIKRILSVWFRHVKVYTSNFISNAFPPFFEPLIFLGAIGLGLGSQLKGLGSKDYIDFLASGLVVTSAMYTAAFECTFGTFIRLEFDKVYDGMLGSPISYKDVILGEVLFAATKGFFFSFAVLIIIWVFGIITNPLSILAPIVGFLGGMVFSLVSLCITSFVKNINHFNFYFTGLITPMFMFSGIIFPVDNLPIIFKYVALALPLVHLVNMARAFCISGFINLGIILDLLYVFGFILIFGWLAIKSLKRRLIV